MPRIIILSLYMICMSMCAKSLLLTYCIYISVFCFLATFRTSEATDAHMNYNYTTKPRVVLPPNYVKGKCILEFCVRE